MYGNREGVPQDNILAHMGSNLAASNVDIVVELRDVSATNRDLVAARMTPNQIAEAQRLARDWKPTAADGLPALKPEEDIKRPKEAFSVLN